MIKSSLIGLFFLITIPAWSAGPQRLDLFNASGSLLLQVAFEYDGSGSTAFRTVYDAGGYVFRRTAVTPGRQDYTGGNGDLTNYVTHAENGGVKTVSIFSEFDQLLFRDSYPITSSDSTYSFGSSGSITYHYESSRISRINIHDKGGNLTHYALADYQTAGIGPRVPAEARSMVREIKRPSPGIVSVAFFLERSQSVSAGLYDLGGNLRTPMLSRKFEKGLHTVILDAGKDGAVTESGIYIIRFSLGEAHNTFKMKVVR